MGRSARIRIYMIILLSWSGLLVLKNQGLLYGGCTIGVVYYFKKVYQVGAHMHSWRRKFKGLSWGEIVGLFVV